MKKVIILAVALLTGGIVDVKALTPEITAAYQQDDREKFRKEMDAKVEEYRKELSEMRAELKKDKAKFDAKVEKNLDELEARTTKLKAKVDAYDAKADWNKFKEEAKHDSEELGKAIKNFFKDNK